MDLPGHHSGLGIRRAVTRLLGHVLVDSRGRTDPVCADRLRFLARNPGGSACPFGGEPRRNYSLLVDDDPIPSGTRSGRRGLGFYWTVASLLGQDILVYSRTVLGLSESMAGVPLAVLGLGVGVGSLLASRLSGPKVEYGLIPLGAVLMAFASLTLVLFSPGFSLLLVFMVILGAASGLLLVPLNSLIQWKSPDDRRGGIIALSNIFVFSGIFAGSVGATLLANSGLPPQAILGAASIVILLGTGWALWLLPDALLRLALILATHTFYRLRIMGSRHVPREGGALLAPNHVSFVDALMLIASLDRPIRFIVHQDYFDYWLFRPFMKSMGCIPIVASGGTRVILKALRTRDATWKRASWSVSSRRGRLPEPELCFLFAGALSGLPVTGRPPSFRSIWTVSGGASSAARGDASFSRFPARFPIP